MKIVQRLYFLWKYKNIYGNMLGKYEQGLTSNFAFNIERI